MPDRWDALRAATLAGREGAADTLDISGAAHDFLERCGIKPTPDVVEQLIGPFVHCLRIVSERGYEEGGQSWKEQGWRGQLFEVMKRAKRMQFFAWDRRKPLKAMGSAEDIINYAAFFMRMVAQDEHNVWGGFGEPDERSKS